VNLDKLKCYNSGVKVLSEIRWIPILLTRLTLAGVFIESGWGKLHNLEKVVGFFTDLGIPAPVFQAHLVAYTEFTCGTALLFGFLTRLASVPLSITMIVALLTAKKSEITAFTDIFGLSEFLYLLLLVWLICEGAGPISIDRIIVKKYKF